MREKNKNKDHANARADLRDMGTRPELHPNATSTKLAASAIKLNKKEKQELCEFFRSVKVPSGYSSNIRKFVHAMEQKFLPMKAHDCVVMLTTMLVVGIQNILPEKVHMTIMGMCFFFNATSQKVIYETKLDVMEQKLFKTMCLFEAYFPPSFFDVSVHLVAHLIKEIRYVGPLFLHHMYPYETFMSTLNKYSKSHIHPKERMAEGYSCEEVVDWCLVFIDPENPIGVARSCHDGRLAGSGFLGEKTFNPDVNSYRQLISLCCNTH
jgi:hypothetical protein